MDKNSNMFSAFIGGVTRAVLLVTLMAAFLFTFSQTSLCPPNFKVILDFGFESAVKAAEPYKQNFPKPMLPRQAE